MYFVNLCTINADTEKKIDLHFKNSLFTWVVQFGTFVDTKYCWQIEKSLALSLFFSKKSFSHSLITLRSYPSAALQNMSYNILLHFWSDIINEWKQIRKRHYATHIITLRAPRELNPPITINVPYCNKWTKRREMHKIWKNKDNWWMRW